jgi:hypothetical protein
MLGAKTGPVGPSNVRSWHLTDVHADRYRRPLAAYNVLSAIA